jgi:hypothetical protein
MLLSFYIWRFKGLLPVELPEFGLLLYCTNLIGGESNVSLNYSLVWIKRLRWILNMYVCHLHVFSGFDSLNFCLNMFDRSLQINKRLISMIFSLMTTGQPVSTVSLFNENCYDDTLTLLFKINELLFLITLFQK